MNNQCTFVSVYNYSFYPKLLTIMYTAQFKLPIKDILSVYALSW